MNNPTLKSMNFPLKLVSMLPKSSESEKNVNQLDNLFSRITFFNFFCSLIFFLIFTLFHYQYLAHTEGLRSR